ncbi:MAG: PPOX class F420-dependent oxidoreductase [Anaerolineales bacterium]
MSKIPETHLDLLQDETRAISTLATIMPDGSPQVTPVWFSFDGESIWINSAKGRLKDRNMRARPQVALCILDPQNPYRYLQIRGRVVEVTEEGAVEHIHQLSHKYMGQDWNIPLGEVRVRYRLAIERVGAH